MAYPVVTHECLSSVPIPKYFSATSSHRRLSRLLPPLLRIASNHLSCQPPSSPPNQTTPIASTGNRITRRGSTLRVSRGPSSKLYPVDTPLLRSTKTCRGRVHSVTPVRHQGNASLITNGFDEKGAQGLRTPPISAADQAKPGPRGTWPERFLPPGGTALSRPWRRPPAP